MRKVRSTVAVLGLVAALSGTGAPPASAGAGAFTGTVTIDCYGCGVAHGTGSFTLSPGGPFWADFWVHEPTGPGCVVSGTAAGEFRGSVNGSFVWTRIFSTLHISTNGSPGSGTFVVTAPPANYCGQTVTAVVSGTLVF